MVEHLAPAILAFLCVLALSPVLIKALKTYNLTQPIRSELPSDHQLKKGTPLMAGSIFLIGVLIALLFNDTILMYFLAATFILFSLIGFADDFWKASRQDPGGISGKSKLVFQFGFTIFLLLFLALQMNLENTIHLTHHISIQLPGMIYIAVMTLFIVGSANAINFTDGMDGLLGMVSIPTYFFFFLISDKPEVKLFSLIMIACLAGFLIFNLYPAKAFMGDTGSLALGGSLSFLAVIEKVEILIPLLFFVYLAEQLSVIIQVAVYKRTKKRIFRMTPIHYHYGLKYGWSENMIVTVFSIVSWTTVILAYLYWKMFLS